MPKRQRSSATDESHESPDELRSEHGDNDDEVICELSSEHGDNDYEGRESDGDNDDEGTRSDDTEDEHCTDTLKSFAMVLAVQNNAIPDNPYAAALKQDIQQLIIEAKLLQSFYEKHAPEDVAPSSIASLQERWAHIKGLASSLSSTTGSASSC
jgi:hypothetical protein